MTISYSAEQKFALLDTGSSNWGAEFNNIVTSIDRGPVLTFVAEEIITQYDAVYISSTNKVSLADADAASKKPVIGIALADADIDEEVKIQFFGWINYDDTNHGGALGASANSLIYLSTTAGRLSITPNISYPQVIGVAKTTTTAHITRIVLNPCLHVHQLVTEGDSPTFVGLTLTGLTASKLVATGTSKELVSLDRGNLTAGSNKISIGGTGTGALIGAGASVDVVEGSINHDGLLNFVADEHIAHSGVSISPGTGMSGGGTIAATRTLDCTITQYTDALARAACIAASISDGDTTHSPDGNSVFDALALKAPIASPTFTGTVTLPASTLIPNSGTLGQAAGPLLTFNDTDNYLGITGCNIGLGTATPNTRLHIFANGATTVEATRITSAPGYNVLLRFTGAEPAGTNPNTGEYNLAGIEGHPDGTWGGMLKFDVAPVGTTGGANLSLAMAIRQDGRIAIGDATTAPAAQLHINHVSTTGAIPVLKLTQADVSEEFIRFVGVAADNVITQSIVAAADVGTATVAGYLRVYVQDDGNQITDQAYYMPIYTLAAP